MVKAKVDIISRNSYFSAMKNTIAERFERLLGGHGTRAKVARALGYRREHVGKVLNGSEPVPESWIAVLELLEALPENNWPDRWKQQGRL